MKNKELIKLLEKNEFELVRQKKHYVFKHLRGLTFCCSKTTSDNARFMKNITSELRNLMKNNNLEFIK